MLVKAKWKVKDASGWHVAGEVFETEDDLGDAVKKLEPTEPAEEKKTEAPEKETPKVKPAGRRKTSK